MSKTMTNPEYVDAEGAICPYCKSSDIVARDLDHCGTVIYQAVVCHVCEQEWTDEFTLTGFSPVE